MGCCSSTGSDADKAARLHSKQLDSRNAKDKQREAAIKKLLLLGAGESGKSTLFKQMITLYGKGFSEKDRMALRDVIHLNSTAGMKILVEHARILQADIPDCEIQDSSTADTFIAALTANKQMGVTKEAAEWILKLWADPGIQCTYENRAKFQLFDGAKYFFEASRRLAEADYIPTQEDLLRSRVRTTGIVETAFAIGDSEFKMFDVGGQRNERRKWVHCFEDVTALLFVVAISEYDQVLYEDDTMNRMDESMKLFREMCNSRWFQDTSIILFLNKRDLFEEKIKKVPLTVCFPDYDGENTYEAGTEFIKETFQGLNESASKEVYAHVTCATDSDNVAHVFNAVKDIVIRQSLREGGLAEF